MSDYDSDDELARCHYLPASSAETLQKELVEIVEEDAPVYADASETFAANSGAGNAATAADVPDGIQEVQGAEDSPSDLAAPPHCKIVELQDLYAKADTNAKCCKKDCSKTLSIESARLYLINFLALDKPIRDAMLAMVASSGRPLRCSEKQRKGRAQPTNLRTAYFFRNNSVCRNFIMALYGTNRNTLLRLAAKVDSMLSNTDDIVSFDETRGGDTSDVDKGKASAKLVVGFIDALASKHALPDPGRSNRSAGFGLYLQLPATFIRAECHKRYRMVMAIKGESPVGIGLFNKLWNECRPNVVTLSNRSDMCSTCAKLHGRYAQHIASTAPGSSVKAKKIMDLMIFHRSTASAGRAFYKEKQREAREAWEQRIIKDGVIKVKLVVLSMDFAQSVEIPCHPDQEGDIFSLSPLKLGIFGIADEGRREQTTFLLPEEVSFKKSGSAVGSMLLKYLSDMGVEADEIHIFADNASSQNKNQFVFSMLQMISVRNMFGAKKIRLCFMTPGHTKFAPDGWFGLLKRLLRRLSNDTILDIEQAVSQTGRDPKYIEQIGGPGERHHPKFTHHPVTHAPLMKSLNLTELHRKYFKNVTGTTLMYDIVFNVDGTFDYRGSPCGDGSSNAAGRHWSKFDFVMGGKMGLLKTDNFDLMESAPLDIMDDERKAYLRKKIFEFVQAGTKTYALRPKLGPVNCRSLTIPSGVDDEITGATDDEDEDKALYQLVHVPNLLRTDVLKMNKKERIDEVLKQTKEYSEEDLKKLSRPELQDILYKFTSAPTKRGNYRPSAKAKKTRKKGPIQKKTSAKKARSEDHGQANSMA